MRYPSETCRRRPCRAQKGVHAACAYELSFLVRMMRPLRQGARGLDATGLCLHSWAAAWLSWQPRFCSMLSSACTCATPPNCAAWSCDLALVASHDDEWPEWPMTEAPERRTPRDNLAPPSAARWRVLHNAHLSIADAATENNRLAFLGDSITEGWLRTGFSGKRLHRAARLRTPVRAPFGRWGPLNFGIGGDRCRPGWRLGSNGGLLRPALQPGLFVVLIGTNDLGAGERLRSVERAAPRLAMLHEARPSAKVLVHALFLGAATSSSARQPSIVLSGGVVLNNHFESIGRVNSDLRVRRRARPRLGIVHRLWQGLVRNAPLPQDQVDLQELPAVGAVSPEQMAQQQPPRRSDTQLMYDLLHRHQPVTSRGHPACARRSRGSWGMGVVWATREACICAAAWAALRLA